MPEKMNLAAVTDINRIVHMINEGGYDIAPAQFYDQLLLDTIELGREHYVHLKHTENYTLPRGTKALQKRRWGGLTAHTTPLLEGIPPHPDKTSMEHITFTATAFGRYLEFTDRVNLDQIDPIIAHYTKVLGDVMVRTLERYARETLLSAASKLFANNRTSVGELQIGDKITIADLRFIVLRMERLIVKPLPSGYFNYICSPEFLFDLLDDELVEKYMQINQTTKQLYESGQPFPLFRVTFIPTMLDEFYTPELDNVGEWFDGTNWKLRVFAVDEDKVYYGNIPHTTARTLNDGTVYLHDGTAIKAGYKVSWDKADWVEATMTVTEVDYGADPITTKTITAVASNPSTDEMLVSALNAYTWYQLPVHKGILYGQEALIKIGISGESNAKTYIQSLGSAGVLDPIHQRQTIGAKINSVGFGVLRDEAIVVTFSVPSQAVAVSGLTADVVKMAQATGNATPDDATDELTHREYTVDPKDITKGTNIQT